MRNRASLRTGWNAPPIAQQGHEGCPPITCIERAFDALALFVRRVRGEAQRGERVWGDRVCSTKGDEVVGAGFAPMWKPTAGADGDHGKKLMEGSRR